MSDKNSEINRLIDIVDLLRSEKGCSWDKEQTSESLIPFFIEEVYEAVECIENNNDDLKEELGDVLLHIVFQSSIANEKGYFNLNDVLKNINIKINAGEKIALVGSTGSGKSTLINLLLLLYDYKEGDVKLDGISIKQISRKFRYYKV